MSSEPRARFRPRGEAYLVTWRGQDQAEVGLDNDIVDLPPHWDPRLAKPPVRARIQRVPGGHRLVPTAGVAVLVNDREVRRQHVLRGGDEIRIEPFFAVYTAAKEELPWPMTVIVWPPSGPPVEIRTHRTRLDIGYTDADLQIDDDTLDKLHCVIKRYRNGLMQIEDNGSYNGVYVDGVKIVDGMNLRDGSEIRIGNSRIKAWADPPDMPEIDAGPSVQDQYDLPDQGIGPVGEPLSPYAVELGPEYAERRRRTFDDDVPTKVEPGGERVDVRPRRRASDHEDYSEDAEPGEDRLPEWAPMERNQPEKWKGKKRSRFQESETGADWEKRDKAGITLIHKKDRPIAPRRGK